MQARFAALFLAALAMCSFPFGEAQARPNAAQGASDALAKSKKRKKKRAQPPPPAPSTSPRAPRPRTASPLPAPEAAKPSLALQRVTLENGLRVVLHPEPSLPVVAVSVSYRAGSSFESAEQQGFSRAVFLHLRGGVRDHDSPRLPPAEADAGADLITFTTVVPPSRTQAVLWREAHRFAHSIETSDVSTLRTALATTGQAPAILRVEQLAYQGCWAYEHPASGWTEDLQRADADSLEAFRRRLVAPNRAVVTVTGRFEPGALLENIRRLFGGIPAVVPSAAPQLEVPDQINQRVDLEKSAQAIDQQFLYGWAVPCAGHADLPAVRLAVAMLRDRIRNGIPMRSDRFSKLPDEAVLHLNLDVREGPSLLTLQVDFPASLDMDDTRKIIDDAMLDLATHGPTAEEMRTAWRDAQLDWLATLGSADGRAEALARAELLEEDASHATERSAGLVANNREQVQRAVQKYLTPIRRNLVERRGPKVEPPPRVRREPATKKRTKSSKRRGKK